MEDAKRIKYLRIKKEMRKSMVNREDFLFVKAIDQIENHRRGRRFARKSSGWVYYGYNTAPR